jgi:hypothetical protein
MALLLFAAGFGMVKTVVQPGNVDARRPHGRWLHAMSPLLICVENKLNQELAMGEKQQLPNESCSEVNRPLNFYFYLLRDPNYRHPLQRLAMVHLYYYFGSQSDSQFPKGAVCGYHSIATEA